MGWFTRTRNRALLAKHRATRGYRRRQIRKKLTPKKYHRRPNAKFYRVRKKNVTYGRFWRL